MDFRRFWPGGLFFSLIGLHGILSFNAARQLSPTWDEIIYPAAGYAQWKTGDITWNTEHGILSKLLDAAPLLPLHLQLPSTEKNEDEHVFGFRFTFQNNHTAQKIIWLSRLPAILFSLLTLGLLGFWSARLWGPHGALLTGAVYAMTPILLSRGSTALLEMPMYFFTALALMAHAHAMEGRSKKYLVLCGAATGLALSCKLPALPLLPAFFLLQWLGRADRPSIAQGIKRFAWLLSGLGIALAGLYAPWKHASLSFHETLRNLFLFDQILPYYWHGQPLLNAPSLLSLYAFVIKAPIPLLLLAITGTVLGWRSEKHRVQIIQALVFVGCCLGSVFFFRKPVTSIQFSPGYLMLAFLAGACGRVFEKSSFGVLHAILLCLLAWGCADMLSVYPNELSYFNFFAGGSAQGYRWLADSDQDWGQTLPLLAAYLEKKKPGGVILCYSGAADPAAWRIHYQDLLSPALVNRFRIDDPIDSAAAPILLAVATKVLQSEPRYTAWLLAHRKPDMLVAQTFFIYDITRDADVWRWMAAVYVETRRLALARAALERAMTIEPGTNNDRQMLAAVDLAQKRMIKSKE